MDAKDFHLFFNYIIFVGTLWSLGTLVIHRNHFFGFGRNRNRNQIGSAETETEPKPKLIISKKYSILAGNFEFDNFGNVQTLKIVHTFQSIHST